MAKTEGNINTWLDQIHNKYKTAVSVDCVIFGYDETGLKVLLIPCDMPPFENKLSLLGDIVHPNETTDQAAHRVLYKRTGLDDIYMEQVQVFSDLNRHPLGRVITVSYYSLIKINGNSFMELKDNHSLQWKNVSEINELAFDHKIIMDTCLERLRKNLREHPIGFKLLPPVFTLQQLQTLYEMVLGVELDKRNFRRKLSHLQILKPTGDSQKDVSHRPAKLYYFDQMEYEERNINGFSFGL
ncbi:MAG: NUDIX hydrolase [Saprospiraceae bacterium]|nr:NUDIX hydrolase [Saprospiraceae bacterium]